MRDKNTQRRLTMAFGCLSLLILSFIFSNSLRDSSASHDQSAFVVELLRPLLTPFLPQGTAAEREELLSFLVRKLAHFTEFAALGFSLGAFWRSLGKERRRRYPWQGAAMCLGSALFDEFLQSFSDRTNSLKDVALDFSGSLFGLGVLWLLLLLWERRRARP